MRLRRAAMLLAVAAAPVCWVATAPGPAQASVRDVRSTDQTSTQTLTVGDSAEAWYSSSPIDICTTPLGCPPPQAPTSPYPADTLHVGVAGGQESARTYLLPDLASLPIDATLLGGEMTLPVAGGNGDGTISADTAKIRACISTKPVPDGTQGSTSPPPAINCDISATPTYDAGHSTFTLDLRPFIRAWANGSPKLGIALEPDTRAAQPTDAWHVAFNGRKRSGTVHISSSITVRISPVKAGVAPVAPGVTPVAPPAPPAPFLPAPAVAGPAVAAPVVAPTLPAQVVQTQPVALSRPFQYPLAFLLPLALLAGAVFFARLFTRDVTPLRPRA